MKKNKIKFNDYRQKFQNGSFHKSFYSMGLLRLGRRNWGCTDRKGTTFDLRVTTMRQV